MQENLHGFLSNSRKRALELLHFITCAPADNAVRITESGPLEHTQEHPKHKSKTCI